MQVERDVKKIEAMMRMKKLRIWNEAIKSFRKHDLVLVTEPPIGAVYTMEPELEAEVRKFEEAHNALVYMVVRSFTTFGKMDSLLFVSDYEEEWSMDREDIDDGIVMTYTINWDMPDCSEMGSIAVERTAAGGLIRAF